MKTLTALKLSLVLAASLLLTAQASLAKDKEKAEDKVVGSIKIDRGPDKSELPGLAKITMIEALTAALKAVPGKPMEADLEDDDGYLVYSILIVSLDKQVSEVTIDAGSGKVLGVEKCDMKKCDAEDEDEDEEE